MTPVPQPPDLPSGLPPAVVAYIRALEATVAALQVKVAALEARLDQNASSSSKPPSSDGPHVKPATPKGPSSTRRGGQPGHPKGERALLQPDEVRALKPDVCPAGARTLAGGDPLPAVHQVHEIPVITPHVVECHRLRYPHCGTTTVPPRCPPRDDRVRVPAVAALLTGSCRRGQRGVSPMPMPLAVLGLVVGCW